MDGILMAMRKLSNICCASGLVGEGREHISTGLQYNTLLCVCVCIVCLCMYVCMHVRVYTCVCMQFLLT